MEHSVDEIYWKRLNEKYTNWYNSYDISPKFSVDAKSYHPNSEEDISEISNKILRYIS